MSAAEYDGLPRGEKLCQWVRYFCDVAKVRESGGSNRGPQVEVFLKTAGVAAGNPWCGAFVYSCALLAGYKNSELPSNPASTYFWYKWAVDTKRLKSGRGEISALTSEELRRCLGVWNGSEGGHIFKIFGRNGNMVLEWRTGEGNTNAQGSREGDGCYRKIRGMNLLDNFPRYGLILLPE